MNTRNILLVAAVGLTILLFVFLSRSQKIRESGGTGKTDFIQMISIIAPLATVLAVMSQLNETIAKKDIDSYARQRDAVDRIWMDIQSYMETHFADVQTLYRQMFPDEWNLLSSSAAKTRDATKDQDLLDHHEIYIAHRVAQATEDIMNYNLPETVTEVWHTRLRVWWASERLQLIWETIQKSYLSETREFVEKVLSSKRKN